MHKTGKYLTKLTSALIALVMLLSCLAGCASESNNDPKETEPNVTQPQSTEAPTNDTANKNLSFKINGVDIEKFVIVYATDDDRGKTDANGDAKKDNDDALSVTYAKNLQSKIRAITGKTLEISNDSAAEAEYEIIIGNVEREITNDFYKNTYENVAQYKLAVSGKKAAFLWLGDTTIKTLMDKFINKYLQKGTSSFDITDADSFAGDVKSSSAVDINARINETDLRIACNNIYAHQDFGRLSFYTNRKALLLSSIILWDADILLFQEYGYDVTYSPSGTTWHTVLDSTMEELGYKQVPFVQDPKASENYTPIWYRPEKVEVIESKYYLYDTVKYKPNAHVSESKSYTMAVFKEKASGKQFACISTHLTYCKDATLANTYRISDAKEVCAEIKDIQTRYGADFPVFLMGDFNCRSGSEPYNIIKEVASNIIISPGIKKNNTEYATHHEFGKAPSQNAAYIDHTMITGSGYKPTQYQFVINHWSLNSTDHLPLLLDVDFRS